MAVWDWDRAAVGLRYGLPNLERQRSHRLAEVAPDLCNLHRPQGSSIGHGSDSGDPTMVEFC